MQEGHCLGDVAARPDIQQVPPLSAVVSLAFGSFGGQDERKLRRRHTYCLMFTILEFVSSWDASLALIFAGPLYESKQ